MFHPLPWTVKYDQKFPGEWHPKSSPYIVDAKGKTVVHARQYVNHPGKYDAFADQTMWRIVKVMNAHPEEAPLRGVWKVYPVKGDKKKHSFLCRDCAREAKDLGMRVIKASPETVRKNFISPEGFLYCWNCSNVMVSSK